MPKYEVVACPFCGDGSITLMVFGGCWQEKRAVTATFGARKNKRKSAKQFIVQNDCLNCGKKSDEIEKAL